MRRSVFTVDPKETHASYTIPVRASLAPAVDSRAGRRVSYNLKVLRASETPARYTQRTFEDGSCAQETLFAVAYPSPSFRCPGLLGLCNSLPASDSSAKRGAFFAGKANRAWLGGERKAPVAYPRPCHAKTENFIGAATGCRPESSGCRSSRDRPRLDRGLRLLESALEEQSATELPGICFRRTHGQGWQDAVVHPRHAPPGRLEEHHRRPLRPTCSRLPRNTRKQGFGRKVLRQRNGYCANHAAGPYRSRWCWGHMSCPDLPEMVREFRAHPPRNSGSLRRRWLRRRN